MPLKNALKKLQITHKERVVLNKMMQHLTQHPPPDFPAEVLLSSCSSIIWCKCGTETNIINGVKVHDIRSLYTPPTGSAHITALFTAIQI